MPAAQIDNSQKRNAAVAAEMENRKQRKKILIAIGLIVIMVVLWVRLLSHKNVPTEAAAVTSDTAIQIIPAMSSSITCSELPVIPGRNDILKRDIFASNGWKDFKTAGGESNIESSNSPYISAEMSEAVNALELTAIITGNPEQAFINDKLMVIGQRFNFIFKDKKYEFTISEINDLQVKLDCCGRTVVKKIVQPVKMP